MVDSDNLPLVNKLGYFDSRSSLQCRWLAGTCCVAGGAARNDLELHVGAGEHDVDYAVPPLQQDAVRPLLQPVGPGWVLGQPGLLVRRVIHEHIILSLLVRVLHFGPVHVSESHHLTRPEGTLHRIAADLVLQLGPHERGPLARLHVQKLCDPEWLAVDLYHHPILKIVRGDLPSGTHNQCPTCLPGLPLQWLLHLFPGQQHRRSLGSCQCSALAHHDGA
mmetsp:Transcript_4616/g.13261  ORF Transcript_4616/g.13261 Transcript_4616/m.13261 type:complete len:220 (+) Transcript_4616:636-1295(+)